MVTEKQRETPSLEYVTFICHLYGDRYDDREEDSKINGLNWEPGIKAGHKSMAAFQRELEDVYGIHLSRTKLQKILITGGCWTTERSREIQWLYEEYTAPVGEGGKGLSTEEAIRAIAKHLGISTVSVIINLPYGKVVYGLENKSANAKRIDKWRAKKKNSDLIGHMDRLQKDEKEEREVRFGIERKDDRTTAINRRRETSCGDKENGYLRPASQTPGSSGGRVFQIKRF